MMKPKLLLGLALVLSGMGIYMLIANLKKVELYERHAGSGKIAIQFEIQTNPPDIGIPEEARRQKMIHDDSHGTIAQLLDDTLDSVTVRYFSNIWTNQQQVSDYVLGMLADKRTETYSWQIWSQGVREPEIDCLLTFKNHRQGRLLVWGTAACLRDEKGRWWFVNVFDYFHLKNPKGTRILSHENLQQP